MRSSSGLGGARVGLTSTAIIRLLEQTDAAVLRAERIGYPQAHRLLAARGNQAYVCSMQRGTGFAGLGKPDPTVSSDLEGDPHFMLAVFIAITVIAGTTGNGYSTPVPPVTPLTAPLGQNVPIGSLSVTIQDLRAATPADNPDQITVLPDQRLMVIHILLANSVPPAYTGVVTYTLEDKNGVGPRAWDVKPSSLNIAPGASVHLTGLFTVGKTFVP